MKAALFIPDMEDWRIIKHDSADDYYRKMALDEAVLMSVSQNESPTTLRFYRWNKPAVSVGFFQDVNVEVDVEACRRDKVAIFRRMTGGGAVYKDPEGELNYSLIIKESHPLIPGDILLSYQAIERGIVAGLALLGVQAELSGLNDLVVKGKKISGNAQTRKAGVILQHGTILLDFDVERMARYLKAPREKLADKGLPDIKARVGTLREYLPDITLARLEEVITEGFCQTFGARAVPGEPSQPERDLQEKLYREKYTAKEWNYWRQ